MSNRRLGLVSTVMHRLIKCAKCSKTLNKNSKLVCLLMKTQWRTTYCAAYYILYFEHL